MKVLSSTNAAVAVDSNGRPVGIVTRIDLLEYVSP
jgi:predicted transcriptional regulator